VLVPDPGYPTYHAAVKLAGAEPVTYTLSEENNYEPELEKLAVTGCKLMFVNYPQMPTGHLPTMELFEKIIAFARKNNILVCHDNPYSFILNDHPLSMLAVDGAMDCVIELNSLSKSHNMAGWRIGMLCGAQERIDQVIRFKSNMDSGMFLPLQLAAAKALTLDRDWFDSLNATYRERREKIYVLLDKLNCSYSGEQAGLFVWAKVPEDFKDGYALSDEVLYNKNVFITPGGIFGKAGEQYVRLSLCIPVERIMEAIARI
jgi:aspartate/methionine/tyrosine aminotransferase